MDIVTVQFDIPGHNHFSSLLDVFRHSVKKYAQHNFVEIKIPTPENETGSPNSFYYNHQKLKLWVDYLKQAKDNVIFCDCDMIMINNPEEAFNQDFDIAFTECTNKNFGQYKSINCGVMFAKPTIKAIQFFSEMLEVDREMLENPRFHNEYRRFYIGLNQSSFACVCEKYKDSQDIKIHKFKTIDYNAVECDWGILNDPEYEIDTKFIHIKGNLKRAVLSNRIPRGSQKKVMGIWYNLKNEMQVEIREENIRKLRSSN